jgi:uncharacterized membrane protein
MFQPFIAALTGTSVEFFETVVIAYAIIRAGHPREAISAVIIGHLLVFIAAFFLLPAHTAIPVDWLRLIAALLLTAMGLYWAFKSAKRQVLNQRPRWVSNPLGKVGITAESLVPLAFSPFVFLVMAKSAVIEATEILLVVFPVAAISGDWPAVLGGAFTGIAIVTLLAILLHKRLQSIPEVKLKLAIGLLLAGIGISWLLEIYSSTGFQLARPF